MARHRKLQAERSRLLAAMAKHSQMQTVRRGLSAAMARIAMHSQMQADSKLQAG